MIHPSKEVSWLTAAEVLSLQNFQLLTAANNEVKHMALLTDCSAEVTEIQQLSHLLPSEMRSCTSVVRSTVNSSWLIATERIQKGRFEIQINLTQWQALPANHKDLLF